MKNQEEVDLPKMRTFTYAEDSLVSNPFFKRSAIWLAFFVFMLNHMYHLLEGCT